MFTFRRTFLSVVAVATVLTTSPVMAAEIGVTDDTILIGSTGGITGGAAFIGLGGKAGNELAYKEINDAGGIHGRKLEMIFEDDGFSASRALASTKKLVEQDQVFMINGFSGSNPTIGTIGYLREAKVPAYISFSNALAVSYPFNRYLFRGASVEPARLGEINSELFSEFLKVKRLAILSGVEENLKAEADATIETLDKWYGTQPVMRAEFKVGDKDFTPQLLEAKQSNPDLIYAIGQLPEILILVRQARELGLTQPIMVAPSCIDNTLIANLGPNAEGLFGLWGAGEFVSSSHPDMVKFRESWAKLNPNAPAGRPNMFDVWGYTEVYVIAEALKNAGRDLTREKFIDELEKIQGYRVSGIATPRTFTNWHHNGNMTFLPMVVVAGQWVPLRWVPTRETELLEKFKK